MTGTNKVIDDFSRVLSGAMGVAQGAKSEAETTMKSWVEKFMNSQGYVSREEFEAVAEMAKTARREIEELKAEVEAMKKPKRTTKKPAAKAATKPPSKTTRKAPAK